jgi:metallo-beta-lactamase family protein
MRITFCGAAKTVTGSKHLVELADGTTLLLDCGLFQGRRAVADEMNERLLFDPAKIDVVLLSHAHIDHSGLLPKLYKEGFRGKIWATHATYSLCALMLLDSAHIQEKDIRFVNKIRARHGEPPREPLYQREHAEKVLDLFVGVSYRQRFSPAKGVSVEYRDAVHILGSATMVLTVTENGRETRLGFTGDVGSPGRPILRDPQTMEDCDFLITESTYGGKVHEPADRAKKDLAEVVKRTSGRGGRSLSLHLLLAERRRLFMPSISCGMRIDCHPSLSTSIARSLSRRRVFTSRIRSATTPRSRSISFRTTLRSGSIA